MRWYAANDVRLWVSGDDEGSGCRFGSEYSDSGDSATNDSRSGCDGWR